MLAVDCLEAQKWQSSSIPKPKRSISRGFSHQNTLAASNFVLKWRPPASNSLTVGSNQAGRTGAEPKNSVLRKHGSISWAVFKEFVLS